MNRDDLLGPVAGLLDAIIPDRSVRDAAKLELLRPENAAELDRLRQRIAADPWTGRARPAFLYVMYTLLLWAIPMGLVAAVDPARAAAIAGGMTAYLSGIPEPLFGTGYLGYTAARTWGKARGMER